MGKAWRTPSLVALALLAALLAASLAAAAEEESAAPPAVADAADAPPPADEDMAGGGDGAPAPAPASQEEGHKTIGAKAKAGLHTMMKGISAGKDKLECNVLGRHCPASEAPSAQ